MLSKEAIRQLALHRRAALTEAQRQELSRRIHVHILSHPWIQAAAIVHTYCSFGSEVETHELCRALLERGKRVAVPVVPPGATELLHVWLRPGMRFRSNRWGIPEPEVPPQEWLPTEALELRASDVVLVPLVAYDRQLYRLGYGRGFYDRFLRQVPARRVGLAFSVQAVEELPHEPHDVPLHAVITEEGVVTR